MNLISEAIVRAIPIGFVHLVSRNQWRYPWLRGLCSWGESLVRNQDGTIQHGVAKGLKFNVGNSHSGFLLGSHEPAVQNLLAAILRPGMVFYDAGANVGYFAIMAARLVGSSGQVVCIEALPSNAAQIEHNARINKFWNVIVLAEALGASERTDYLRTSEEPIWGKLSGIGPDPDKYAGKIEITVRTLDKMCSPPDNRRRPDAIKIDIEGAEVEALMGGRSVISQNRPILMIELHGTNAEVSSLLDEFGYQTAVMGSAELVRNAHWNSFVIAVPSERADLVARLPEWSIPRAV